MNYDKRKSEVCRECPIKDNCLYITRGLSDKCERNQLIMEGWEKGWEDAFEETVEFLKYYIGKKYNFFHEDDIEAYKKAMEEQQ